MFAVFVRLTVTKFRIIEELANSNENDCFTVTFSMTKRVACAAVTVRKELAATFVEKQ
jgi:hypothetical protein